MLNRFCESSLPDNVVIALSLEIRKFKLDIIIITTNIIINVTVVIVTDRLKARNNIKDI